MSEESLTFKVDQFVDCNQMIPDDILRVHPSRDTRPWWQRVKLSPWRGTEKVRGKKETITGIKGGLEF